MATQIERDYQKEKRNKLKLQGICTRCGKKKVVRGIKGDMTTYCKECLEKHILRNKKSCLYFIALF